MHNVSTTHSDLWERLLDRGDVAVELRLQIGAAELGEDKILSVRRTGAVFAGSTPTVGGTVAGELTVDLLDVDPGTVPRMAELRPALRLVPESGTAAEWVPKGIYYVDTRSTDADTGEMELHCYDAMLKTEQDFVVAGDQGQWPLTDAEVVAEICQRIGVELDSRTVLDKGYDVQYPGGYSMREVLGYIGAMYGGNWIITDEGKLRLLRLNEAPDLTEVGMRSESLTVGAEFAAISMIRLRVSDEVIYDAGSEGGYVMEIECPWGTRAMADDLLAALGGMVYQPFETGGARLDPAAELGDAVLIDRYSSGIYQVDDWLTGVADIAAPGEAEIDHEYPYESRPQRAMQRKIEEASATLEVSIDQIRTEVANRSAQVLRVVPEYCLSTSQTEVVLTGDSATLDGTELVLEGTGYRLEGEVLVITSGGAKLEGERLVIDPTGAGGWSTTLPEVDTGLYLWCRSRIYYADGTEATTEPWCISRATTESMAETVEDIRTIQQEQSTQLTQTAEAIRADLDKATRTLEQMGDELAERYRELSASITATAEGIEQQYSYIEELRTLVGGVSEAFNAYRISTEAYIRTGIVDWAEEGGVKVPIYGMAIGQQLETSIDTDTGDTVIEKKNFRAIYTAQRLAFWQDGVEVAYVSNNQLYITNVVALSTLTIGNWHVAGDSSSGMVIKWIGG